MRLSKPLLTRRKDLILLISLLLFSHVGAIGSLTSNAVVPISVSNKSELVVPMNHQHSLEKVQGNIQVKTPSKYTGVEANYKATPLNIHIESARSSSTGSAQTSPSVTYSATAHANAGGGGPSQPRNTTLLKKRKQSTKLIPRSHKWERHNPSSCVLLIVTMMTTGILEAQVVLTTPVNRPLYLYP